MKRIFSLFLVLVLLAIPVTNVFAGFDEFGYNDVAGIFNGSAGGWCASKGWGWDCTGYPSMIPYANDHLVMKWNAEWDRGNAEGWSNPPYAAWENNEWNGMVPGGSQSVWHYKIVWVGPCTEGATLPEGGYCIWGQFETIMDQGIDLNSEPIHSWYAHANPTGYGSYP
ncbi:hypothetical protein A2V55_02275 [Candidatus Woesebacteria bacterium RBG_19FT_COMBO_37_29]|uniref:Uncharacterized protein n=1 Tax=Candidatus Woesebacteria bacterium RBG_19FT_COMBO_37_29 TaxID=1802486 RepID=A0A1F7XRZ7_9BACT|nr:MAG: hypothetical protein A2V55_02275 [Candidatus Woesebacteria bacterium RBG_19FT_COMBO_37_29]